MPWWWPRRNRGGLVEDVAEQAESPTRLESVTAPLWREGVGARSLKVRYMGLAKNVVGKNEEEVAIPGGAKVRDLLEILVERHGEDLKTILFSAQGTVRSTASVLVGGQDVRGKDGLDTRLDGVQEASLMIVVNSIMGG